VAPEPRTPRASGGLIAMPDEPEKPRHPGMFPAGLVLFGLLVMLGIGFFVTKLLEFIRWITQ
jgi:hypothetical protein